MSDTDRERQHNKSMSDTPRTDAKLLSFDTFNGIDPWKGERFIKVVPANFARELERELAEARERIDKLESRHRGLCRVQLPCVR